MAVDRVVSISRGGGGYRGVSISRGGGGIGGAGCEVRLQRVLVSLVAK